MSAESEFYVPDDAILRELGHLQIVHSHLDHMLRLAIKRMLGISIDDPGYWGETKGMSAGLRGRARELIAERYGNDEDTADILNKVLDDAEEVTTLRNRALHSVWMKAPDSEAVLHDRDNLLKVHVAYQLPSAETLAGLSQRISRVQGVLNSLTRKLLPRP